MKYYDGKKETYRHRGTSAGVVQQIKRFTMSKIYTAEEIARHNHNEDLWLVIHGSVYNLTKFYKEHPGGEEVLLQLAGKNGSKCFDSIGHSDEAIMLRDTFKIGELQEGAELDAPIPAKAKPAIESTESTMTQDEDWQSQKQDDKKNSMLPLIGILVLIYAFIMYYIWF